jgi:2'-5' RNA ligase
MTRTFIALELAESLQSRLGEIIHLAAQELPNLRWVDPAGIHLTLAFLGELTAEQLAQAIQAAEQTAQNADPFDYRLSHPGVFGSPRQPRVFWLGIDEPTGKLLQLHHLLNRELEQRGFEVDTRPFSPHFTLSRIKEPLKPEEQQRLQRLLARKGLLLPSSSYHVREISVMKSELSRLGAKYSCLRKCALGT